MWLWNNRTHPELEWQTLSTEHFNIHFHQGLESIAEKGALIAEQSYRPILDQLQLEDFGKTDMVFSAEDEIMNGFAVPSRQIFIWVSQNDVAGDFGGSEKWLKLAITHEFQHIAQFEAHRTWAGIWAGLSIPNWWFEGMAEYMTEVWRVGRSDSQMKIHTYGNTLDQLNAHDDGYAKVLYLAWKYGDSSLVKISNQRSYLLADQKKYPFWYDFKTAFEKVTGQTQKDFDEEWRRVMNTYYYGYKAQKETIEAVGEPLPIKGFSQVQSVMLSPDSTQALIIGRKGPKMRDYGLYTLSTDSTKKSQEVHYGRFNGDVDWSPDGQSLVVSEFHRGQHGSLLNDIRLIDLEAGKKKWITKNFRALHPVFSGDSKGVFFVAHPNETTQIYYQNLTSNKRIQVSQFEGDVQIQSLDLSPDGNRLTFMIQDSLGAVDIAIMQIDGSRFQKVTNDSVEDMFPIWTADAKAIVFTSFRNSTPNLYRVDLDNLNITQMTDVAEGIYSRQRLPLSEKIVASTLADVDSVRLRSVSAHRVAPTLGLQIQEPYNAWRSKSPDIPLPSIDYKADPPSQTLAPYSAVKTFRPLFKFIWPLGDGFLALASINDALGKHVIQGGFVLPYDGSPGGVYLSYINLEYLPVLNFFASQNIATQYRGTYLDAFYEIRDGLGLALSLPMNTGNSLSSNHTLQGKIHGIKRKALRFEELVETETGDILVTQDTDELNFNLTYIWKSQRPNTDTFFMPRDGKGILAHIEKTAPAVWGEGDYSQFWLEGFFNYDIPGLPVVLYSRMKYVGQNGTILPQDKLGFSETAPVYLSTAYMTTIRSTGIFDAPESYNLRGQKGQYPASELIYSVSELRMPLMKKIPINLFGLGFQNFTAAAFYDFGYIPESSTQLSTYGAEIKFDVSLFQLPIVTLAYGWGGDSDYWNRAEAEPDFWGESYLRMGLVNPF